MKKPMLHRLMVLVTNLIHTQIVSDTLMQLIKTAAKKVLMLAAVFDTNHYLLLLRDGYLSAFVIRCTLNSSRDLQLKAEKVIDLSNILDFFLQILCLKCKRQRNTSY